LASSPDGNTLAVLLQSNNTHPQLYTLDLRTLKLTQRTFVQGGVTTAISWSRSGSVITFGADNAIFVLDTITWKAHKVASVTAGELLPLCCCISPDEKRIAVEVRHSETNHIAIATLE
jgi:Tol biopolymer transport system component